MPVLAFIGRGIEKQFFKSLDQLNPDDSSLLDKLNDASNQTDIPYYLIAGETKNIEANFEQSDRIWKKVKAVSGRFKYILGDFLLSDQSNDLLFKEKSMKALPWDFTAIHQPSCHHFEYLTNEESLKYLKDLL